VTVPQVPVPVHMAAGVSMPPWHIAFPHWVVLGACSHIPPVQFPVLPQGGLAAH
jgi:hypothetical protein